jgi:hypothetical protein
VSILRAEEEASPQTEGKKSKESFHLPSRNPQVRARTPEGGFFINYSLIHSFVSLNKYIISTLNTSDILVYFDDTKIVTELKETMGTNISKMLFSRVQLLGHSNFFAV